MIGNLGRFLDKLKPKYDDDVIDRCNYLVTNTILFICAITVAAKQYVGEPLQCWAPAEFKSGWEQYVENYCFVENTYFVTMDDQIPEESGERNERELHYYQWVPFILMLQALLFMIPRTVWKTLNWQTGMNIFALSQAAYVTKRHGAKRFLKKDETEPENLPVVRHLNYVINFNKKKELYSTSPLPFIWRTYVTHLYLFCKLLNLINICFQFGILNHFLGPQYYFWGIGVLNDLLHGRQWSESGHFPRVTLCDVNIREIGNTNRKTVQCVLMINMFNEKIFLGIWFWLLILGFLTFVNFVYWAVISLIPRFGKDFIEANLTYKRISYTSEELDEFLTTAIYPDGITVLRLISDNAGESIASEVIAGLWKMYKEDCKSESSQYTEDVSVLSVESAMSLPNKTPI